MTTQGSKNTSIQNALNVQIGLVVLAVGVTIGILFLIFSFQLEKDEFQNAITLQTKHLSDTFTQQLWLFDLNTMQQLCDLAVDSPGVLGVRLYDPNKKPLIKSGIFQNSSAVRIEEELRYEDDTLVGYIEIVFINTTWKKDQVFIILVGCCMMLFTIIASFLLISPLLKRHLVVPLENLQKDMLTLTSGEFKRSNLTGQKAEIQNIIDGFNQMASTLASREASKLTAEAALEKSQNELLSIFRIAPTGIGVVKEKIFYKVNDKFCEMTGYSQEELLGKSVRMLYPANEDFGTESYRQIREKGSGTVETRFKRKDGKIIHILMGSTPLNNNDLSVGVTFTALDITDIKQMEGIVQQAQKMEAIGTLAGGIAHDFNNILFPILGYSEMLLDDLSDEDHSRKSIQNIHAGALRAKELVQQILTFSRQEESEMRLMKIQPILKEALKMIRATVPVTIDIHQDIDPGCNPVKADPTQIHQIIMNLTTNAYHAMEENGGSMEVILKQVELEKPDLINPDIEAGPYACLTVRDTGVGMDTVLTEKIFNPFFTTKENGKGTGMGLSVVHGIVTGMKGDIQIHSNPGKGTEFNVYFPIDKSVIKKNDKQPPSPLQTGTERILLVDDEKDIIAMEKLALERLGYHVTSCTSSIEALETYRAAPDNFDLVITDFAMPKMPGDRLSAELKKINPDIPILLCTGFSESMSKEKAETMGIKGFLLKPIVVTTLSNKIREVLDC